MKIVLILVGVSSSVANFDNLRKESFKNIEKFEKYIRNNKNQHIKNKVYRPITIGVYYDRSSSLEAPFSEKLITEIKSAQQELEHLVHHIRGPFYEPTSQDFIDQMLEDMEISSIKTINIGTVLDFM